MKPDNLSEIEHEIREMAALEASSAVTNLPNVVARNVNPYDEKVNHTDTGVDVVVDNVIDVGADAVIDDPMTFVDVETHVDQ